MKVALTHHQFKLKGGMENYLFNLIMGFKEQQDVVTAYVYKIPAKLPSNICQVVRANLNFLPRPLRKFWFGWRSHKRVAEGKHDASISLMRALNHDIIVCGGTHMGFLVHTKKRASWLDKLEIQLEKRSYESAKIVMAHSDLIRNELIKFYQIPEEKILRLYPPADVTKLHQGYKQNVQQLRLKYNIHPTKTTLLFPSTGHKRKGFFLLADALSQLPEADYELVIAGDPPPIQIRNCRHVGFVENMTELYSACDFTVLPSYYEPFGLVAVESLQCGTPVILSQYVGASELIDEHHGVVMQEQTAAALVDAIKAARSRVFKISDNFVEQKKLTVQNHIHAIKLSLGGE